MQDQQKYRDKQRESTRMAIKDAFLELLAEKDFQHITVREICNKAGIHRTTFYLHYHRADDVLADILEDIFALLDIHCCQYLHYEGIEYEGGVPPCRLVREHRKYLPIFQDSELAFYFTGSALKRYTHDSAKWLVDARVDPKPASGVLAFLIYGCFLSAAYNIDMTDDEWMLVQSVIDDGINAGMDKWRHGMPPYDAALSKSTQP